MYPNPSASPEESGRVSLRHTWLSTPFRVEMRILLLTCIGAWALADDILLFPKMGLLMSKQSNVMLSNGLARARIHVIHDVEDDDKHLTSEKCPSTATIKNDLAIQLSASLTSVSEAFGLQSLVQKESLDNLFGVSSHRGRRSTVSPTMTSISTMPHPTVASSTVGSNTTDSPEFTIHCCDRCHCDQFATNTEVKFQSGVNLKHMLVGIPISFATGIREQDIFRATENNTLSVVVHETNRIATLAISTPMIDSFKVQVRTLAKGVLFVITTGIAKSISFTVKLSGKMEGEPNGDFVPKMGYFSIHPLSPARKRRSLYDLLNIESRRDFEKFVTDENVKQKVSELDREQIKSDLSDFGLVMDDVRRDLTLIHNDLCQNRLVTDSYHRQAVLELRIEQLITKVLQDGQNCEVQGKFNRFPALHFIAHLCVTYYSQEFCSHSSNLKAFEGQIQCESAKVLVNGTSLVISYEVMVPYGPSDVEQFTHRVVDTVAVFNGTTASRVTIPPNVVFVEMANKDGSSYRTTIQCDEINGNFICPLNKVRPVTHACLAAIVDKKPTNMCPVVTYSNVETPCEVLNLKNGLLISADGPMKVYETSAAMGGFESTDKGRSVKRIDFLPHGSKLSVQCQGIRYVTDDVDEVEKVITVIDNITIQEVSNTLTSYDQFLLHHHKVHSHPIQDVKLSFATGGPNTVWTIVIVFITIMVTLLAVKFAVDCKRSVWRRVQAKRVRRRAHQNMELIQS